MADLPNESAKILGDLHDYLHDLLPDASISEAVSAQLLPPLLLLQTTHNVAAFGLPNGDWRANYETQYQGFKQLCTQHQGDWKSLDVNFVYCLPKPDSEFEAFCSKIETDIYFCRKFVIPLDGDIPKALARLPFLPLETSQTARSRPDSAQSFLQQVGVSSQLAKYLVLPHQRSPEVIVTECLAQQLGEPTVVPQTRRPISSSLDRTHLPIKIETIEIENFRAYRKRQEFNIASDITVFYGPNGFGKTSFFDAIDFAVTGSIGRLDSVSDSKFDKVAAHLESDPGKSKVSMTASSNGTKIQIARTVGDRNWAMLNGEKKDRKAILSVLTGTSSPGAERIDHLVRLFRATHQFNQEGQELTREFQKDCRLKADIVSRMLAVEDYNNAVEKTEKVRDHFRKGIDLQNSIVVEAEEQASSVRGEIQRLSRSSEVAGGFQSLEETIEALRARLMALGFSADEDPVDISVARGWRVSVAARSADYASRIARLEELAKDLALTPESRRKLEEHSNALAVKLKEQSEFDLRRSSAEIANQRANQLLVDLNAKIKDLDENLRILEWVRSTKPRYAEAVSQERKLAEESEVLSGQLQEVRSSQEKIAIGIQVEEADSDQWVKRSVALQQKLSKLTSLLESQPQFELKRHRLAAIKEEGEVAKKSVSDLEVRIRQLTQEGKDYAAQEIQLDEEISRSSEQQTELKELLDDVVTHVNSGVCPLCAADYGSKENLLKRVQNYVHSDNASEARRRIQEVREKSAEVKRALVDLSAKKLNLEQQGTARQTETDQLEEALAAFVRSAEDAGISPNLPAANFASDVGGQISSVNLEIEQAKERVNETESRLLSLRESLEANRRDFQQKQFELQAKGKTLTAIRTELSQMRSDPRLSKHSLDTGPEEFEKAKELVVEGLAQTNEQLRESEIAASQRKIEFSDAQQALSAIKPEVQNLKNQIAVQKKAIADCEARLIALKLSPDLTPEGLTKVIKRESQQQADLALLGDSTANLEIAIDAATTAAALLRFTEVVQNAEKRKSGAELERERLAPWASYFNQLKTLLSEQQNNAIDTFTKEYGPRASVIQRRLRSVYGFDDLMLSTDKSEIVVRATRRGESLRPTDYFSQSQQQTLLLSLFLTACSSQTWSNFSPILLDDPVTHFDDLNTYAFLDLLVGLMHAPGVPRQFIVSTCDERLFQLARQKFSHLGSRAGFYQFNSTGKEGPEVDALTPF